MTRRPPSAPDPSPADPAVSDLRQAKLRIEMQAKELERANLQLKESAALKDEFVAKVSHEIRTPLTSIKEGLSLLLEGALGTINAEQRDFLQTMDDDIDRLAELINNTLDISKIEAGRMRMARIRLDVRPLIESMVRSYHPILGRRRVQTVFDGSLPVFADPHRLRQVLANLLSNALKFTGDDGAITFRTGLQDGMVAIAVEDSGPGIAHEDFPKLFQKFSQVGPQGSGHPRGTGLGLAVCKELVELHRGRIAVSSTVGRGSTFTVLLPVYTDALALSEGVQELQRAAGPSHLVGLLAVQAESLCGAAEAGAHRQKLEALAEQVRHQLHRDDVALTMEPFWIAVMALTDISGLRAIARRLREALPGGEQLVIGGALHPGDSTRAADLFKRAASPEGRRLLAEAAP